MAINFAMQVTAVSAEIETLKKAREEDRKLLETLQAAEKERKGVAEKRKKLLMELLALED